MQVLQDIPVLVHNPRDSSSDWQDLMPRRYSVAVQLFSMAAFSLAFFGWLNEAWLFWFDNPVWLNRYTEYGIILGFGLWRIMAEQNPYTRKRFIILVAVVTVFWWLIPWLYPFYESYVGFLWAQPVFPSLHVPGTVTFFLVLGLVFLFGRRIICGFGCPCVGIRETVGFPFRNKTPRSKWTWRLRHSKWFFFIYYVGIMVATQFPPNSWTVSFVGGFYLIVVMTYFGTFFLAPLVGNRFYCRYLCPYGATFGLLNHAGFYGIDMDTDKCIDCRRCEQVCDMGIPVWEQGKQAGRVTAIEDCMGCARCVVSCPTDALEIRDVRNLFIPKLVQNASHLLKRQSSEPLLRREPQQRPAGERSDDWTETTALPGLAQIQAQAARCLDCGVPGCSNACPLSNRIPEWLEAVAAGNIETAAEICHTTSNLPEVCGSLCPQQRLCEGSCTRAKEMRKVFSDMSEMTLRRDLSLLENEGYAIRTHGGAVSTNKVDLLDGQENEYSKRAKEGIVAKTGIAAKAVRFIEKGRSIYLDAGSTVMGLAKLIEGDGCTFVTSAVNTALKLSSTAHSVMQLGGAVNKNTLSCSGPDALLMMDALNIDVAVMSASGFSLDRGFTISNRYECLLKQKVLKKAKKVVMLMDSSKIDKDLTFTFASLEEIDYWVCDIEPDAAVIEKCKEFNVELV